MRVHATLANSLWQMERQPCICSVVVKTAARRFNGDTKTAASNLNHYLDFITCGSDIIDIKGRDKMVVVKLREDGAVRGREKGLLHELLFGHRRRSRTFQ